MTIQGIKAITGLSKVWPLSPERLTKTLKKYGQHFSDIIVQNSSDGEYVNFIALVSGDMSVFGLLVDEKRTNLEELKLMVKEENIIFPKEL